jgi:hypothetical protein
VLFAGAGEDAGSSYATIRSYTTGRDYVQTTSRAASGNLVTVLDGYGTVEAIGGEGYRTTYALPGDQEAPDALRIVSEIEVTGTDADDTSVVLRTTVTNEGAYPVALGVRYLLDFANGGDDGPAWRIGSGDPSIAEGEAAGGASITVAPTAPNAAVVATELMLDSASEAAFSSWNHAFPFAFDFSPAGRDVAGPCGVNDSAMLVYFDGDEASAVTLAPGESSSVSVSILAGEGAGFPVDDESTCAQPAPTATPVPGGPTPSPQPVELPQTGGLSRRR